MGGCTNCKGKTGCDHRKGAMMEEVDAVLARVYPSKTWGEPDDLGDYDHAPTEDEVAALADELASELTAATFVERGGDADPCDYIWILCMGRAPCILAIRDHGAEPPPEYTADVAIASPGNAGARSDAERRGVAIDELYLRVCVSTRARVAACQQVAVSLRDGIVTMRPRAGVYDAPLLHRMQKLVGILPAYDLLHVDFGEIAAAPPGFHAGAWRELYGGEPAVANYLFYPQPTTMVSSTPL